MSRSKKVREPEAPVQRPIQIGQYLVFHRADLSNLFFILSGRESFLGPYETRQEADQAARKLVGGKSLIVKVEGQYESVSRQEPGMEVNW